MQLNCAESAIKSQPTDSAFSPSGEEPGQGFFSSTLLQFF